MVDDHTYYGTIYNNKVCLPLFGTLYRFKFILF